MVSMCPPASSPCSPIGPYWTDEGIVLFLDGFQHGTRLPRDVITDINPHQYHPSNLPGDCWYLLKSPGKKVSEIGFWKPKGDACRIYSDPRVNGWRTTLEYYEKEPSNDKRTDWVMQEYTITHGVADSPEGNGSLCRVFYCNGESGDHRLQQSQNGENVGGYDDISSANDRNSSSDQGLPGKTQVNLGKDEVKPLASNGKEPDNDYISTGNYIELGDLGVLPQSSSSSSVNSSRLSYSSGQLFDYLELDDLTPEISQENKPKSTSYGYRIPASAAPTEVVLSPAKEGSLIDRNTSDSPTESLKAENSIPALEEKKLSDHQSSGSKHAGQSRKPKKARKGSPSNLNNAAAAASSSSSQSSANTEQNKRAVSKKRGKTKYLCFMPF